MDSGQENADSEQFYTGTPQDDAKPASFKDAFKEQDWSQFVCDIKRFIQSMTEKIRLRAKVVRRLLWSLDSRKRRSEDLFQKGGFQKRQQNTKVRSTDILPTEWPGNEGLEAEVKKWKQEGVFNFWMDFQKSRVLFRKEDCKQISGKTCKEVEKGF